MTAAGVIFKKLELSQCTSCSSVLLTQFSFIFGVNVSNKSNLDCRLKPPRIKKMSSLTILHFRRITKRKKQIITPEFRQLPKKEEDFLVNPLATVFFSFQAINYRRVLRWLVGFLTGKLISLFPSISIDKKKRAAAAAFLPH